MQANVEQIEQDIQNFKKQLKIERNLSEHTLRAYECDLHCMLRWIETYHIRALNDKVTMSYFNYLQDEEHLGARSIRRKYVSLRQFFEFLGETYDVHEKFFRFSSRKFQVPKTLPKTLERSEIQRLLSAASKNFQAASSRRFPDTIFRPLLSRRSEAQSRRLPAGSTVQLYPRGIPVQP